MKAMKNSKFAGLMLVMVINSCLANPYIPVDDDQVLLRFNSNESMLMAQSFNQSTESQAKVFAQQLLSTANQPGNSQQYQMAEATLTPYIKQTTDLELMYMWAQIKQHQHSFNLAEKQLSRIFELQPNHVAAHLMASRLALVRQDTHSAKQHCQSLLGHVDVFTVQICLVEVDSYLGNLDDSYVALSNMVERQDLPESHQTWVTLMWVDMALRKNELQTADQILTRFPDFDDRSFLTIWCDVKNATEQSSLIIEKLSGLIQSGLTLEDGLMLRLAVAEQQLNQQNKQDNSYWTDQLNQRIKIRAERNEYLHANEMALYHLLIKPNKEQALYWAKMNWNISKEHQDQILLAQAKSFNGVIK